MCVSDIIEFIIDYESGESYCNTGEFFYETKKDVDDFSQSLITQLWEKFYNYDISLEASSKRIVKAVIYGKKHEIELIGNYDDNNLSWIVSVAE